MKKTSKTAELFAHDQRIGGLVAGIDEAGRGPLAGPVVCACCMLPLGENDMIEGINDSKKVSEKKREHLFEMIKEKALSYSIAVIDEGEIDEINILEATKKAMTQCAQTMTVSPELILIDAVKINCSVPTRSIVKGDATSYQIAAASILAKVTRDRMMAEYDEIYPQYGFAKHKGYGTKPHIDAIKEIGPCPIHRKTFIKNFVGERE